MKVKPVVHSTICVVDDDMKEIVSYLGVKH